MSHTKFRLGQDLYLSVDVQKVPDKYRPDGHFYYDYTYTTTASETDITSNIYVCIDGQRRLYHYDFANQRELVEEKDCSVIRMKYKSETSFAGNIQDFIKQILYRVFVVDQTVRSKI